MLYTFVGNGQRGLPGATGRYSDKGSEGEKGTKGDAVGRYFTVQVR